MLPVATHRNGARNDAARGEPAVARQLNDAISRLDARLSQISNPRRRDQARLRTSSARPTWSSAPPPRSIVPRRRSARHRSISRSQKSLRARTNSITPRHGRYRRAARRRSHPPCAWRRAGRAGRARIFPRSSAICSRSRARSRRCSVPTGSSNRSPPSAANWRKFVTPLPRRCRAARSNRSKTKSARCPAASTIPARAASTARRWPASSARLSEIREVLRSLTPAEQLAGYDEAIRNLGAKLDLILRASDDPSTVHQLEGAIAALRSIVSNVASNDALVRLSDDVRRCRPRSTSLPVPKATAIRSRSSNSGSPR